MSLDRGQPGAELDEDADLEQRFQRVGGALASAIKAVTETVPGNPRGPADVARILGVDKVLASRVLNATRNKDPIAALHLVPGPDPLRRFVRAAGKKGAPAALLEEAGWTDEDGNGHFEWRAPTQ